MSQAEAQRFIDDLQTNGALRDDVGGSTTDSLAAMAEVARRHGYDFDAKEFRQLVRSRVSAANGQLSDGQLDGVVGGTDIIGQIGGGISAAGHGVESVANKIASWF
jgi:hypothetical protein